MTHPPSIVRFERLWWLSTVAWLAGTVLGWARTQAQLAGNPATAPVAAWMQPATVVLVLAITAACWWLAARRGSFVGRWLVGALATWSAVRLLTTGIAWVGRHFRHPVSTACLILAAALAIAAAVQLFRPDAAAWFGETADDDAERAA